MHFFFSLFLFFYMFLRILIGLFFIYFCCFCCFGLLLLQLWLLPDRYENRCGAPVWIQVKSTYKMCTVRHRFECLARWPTLMSSPRRLTVRRTARWTEPTSASSGRANNAGAGSGSRNWGCVGIFSFTPLKAKKKIISHCRSSLSLSSSALSPDCTSLHFIALISPFRFIEAADCFFLIFFRFAKYTLHSFCFFFSPIRQ